MAIIKDFNEEDQKQTLSGESGALGTGAATGSSAPGTPTGGAQGSGWTNLQSYLGANQGQAGGLANQIGEQANKQVDTFKSTKADSAVADINKAGRSDEASTIVGDVAKSADKAKSFLSSGYGGPSVDTYTAGVRNAASQVKDQLGQITDQGYQKSTLQKLNNRATQPYSSGFAALDSFLVSADPNAKAQLKLTQGRAQEVDDTVNQYTGQVQSADKAARDAFASNQQRIRDAAKGQYSNILSGAGGRVGGQAAQQQQSLMGQAKGIVGGQQDEFFSGMSDEEIAPFIKQNQNFGTTDVLTNDELIALNSLAGIDSTLGLSPTSKTNNQAFTFDEAGLRQSIGSKKEAAKAKRQKEIDEENARLQRELDEAKARQSLPPIPQPNTAPVTPSPNDLASAPQANVPVYQPGQVAIDTAGNTAPVPVMNWIPFFDEYLTPEAGYVPGPGGPILTF